jgi:cell division protein FtsL
MLQAVQVKLLAAIIGILLSILGVVTYEHHKAEAARQRIEQQRQAEQRAKEQFLENLQREERDPRNHMRTDWSKFLREH